MQEKILSKRIKEILSQLDWSKEKLAEESGLPLETIRNIYYGKTPDPKVSTVLTIAEATGHSVNCLMGRCEHDTEERTLLRNYRECGPHGKSIIEFIAKYEASAVKNERDTIKKHRIPCLIPHGDIRKGIIYENCESAEIICSVKEAYIAIKMTNNDMAPRYCKNDIILLENRFPNHGEYAGFVRGEKAFIRQFIEEEGVYRLRCIHERDDDIVVKRMDEIHYIGTCCGVVRD